MNETNTKRAKTQKVLTILIIISLALMLPVFIINCTLIIKSLANPDVPPSLFGVTTLYIDEDLSSIDVKKGDMIFIDNCGPEDIEVGDAIYYKTLSGAFAIQTVHTVLPNNEGWYTVEPTEGFNIFNTVSANQLIGEYEGTKIPVLGGVATFTQSIPGIIICLAIPLGLLVAYEVVCAKKKEKIANDDKAELLAELEALRKAKEEADKNSAAPVETPVVEEVSEVPTETQNIPEVETTPEEKAE